MRKKKYLKPPQLIESFKKVLKFVLLRIGHNKYPKNLTPLLLLLITKYYSRNHLEFIYFFIRI